MSVKHILIALAVLAGNAPAYWPTTVEENIPIAAEPAHWENWPTAVMLGCDKILVTYFVEDTGSCYNLIDRFGNLVYPANQLLAPGLPFSYNMTPRTYSDSIGGAYSNWLTRDGMCPEYLVLAQRLDSEGRLMWGDSGIVIHPSWPTGFDLYPDGLGGLLFLFDTGPEIRVQRIDSSGQFMWGPNGALVCDITGYSASWPQVTHNGSGGAYTGWIDYRPPNQIPIGALRLERVNSQGASQWNPGNGIQIHTGSNDFNLIPDAEGGALISAYGRFGLVERVDMYGALQWQYFGLGYGMPGVYDNVVTLGDPGQIYLAFRLAYIRGYPYYGVYAQRLDMMGNRQWINLLPGPLNNLYAVRIAHREGWEAFEIGQAYSSPYFYVVYAIRYDYNINYENKYLFVQAVDSLGNIILGENGVLLSHIMISYGECIRHINFLPDNDGGLVIIFETDDGTGDHSIYAKRIWKDGSLGGPFPLAVSLTPHSPPIQIPSGGGSFIFDVSITDTDSVGGLFDAWVEAVLPSGDTIEIAFRENIPIPPWGTISRLSLEQFVPSRAPAGNYTYIVKVGKHRYNSVWDEDSFIVEKAGAECGDSAPRDDYNPPYPPFRKGGNDGRRGVYPPATGSQARHSGRAASQNPSGFEKKDSGCAPEAHKRRNDGDDWLLTGFFDAIPQSAETLRGEGKLNPESRILNPVLSAHPNPFNQRSLVSFTLESPGEIKLAVYDIIGREVAVLVEGYYPAGKYRVKWNGKNYASGVYFIRLRIDKQTLSQKILLIK